MDLPDNAICFAPFPGLDSPIDDARKSKDRKFSVGDSGLILFWLLRHIESPLSGIWFQGNASISTGFQP